MVVVWFKKWYEINDINKSKLKRVEKDINKLFGDKLKINVLYEYVNVEFENKKYYIFTMDDLLIMEEKFLNNNINVKLDFMEVIRD